MFSKLSLINYDRLFLSSNVLLEFENICKFYKDSNQPIWNGSVLLLPDKSDLYLKINCNDDMVLLSIHLPLNQKLKSDSDRMIFYKFIPKNKKTLS